MSARHFSSNNTDDLTEVICHREEMAGKETKW